MLQEPKADMQAAYGDELPPGTALCHGQYTVERYLNSGGFGVTYLTRDSLGRKVVIKECFPNAMCCRSGEMVRLRSKSYVTDFERVVELFEKEARALAHLQHPNIVGVHQIFKDNGTAYMALDFVDGLDLLDVLAADPGRLTPDVVTSLLSKLLEALTYVHENGILHRDISPDNILLDATGEPVLIDFGAARESASRASRILSRVHTVKDGYSPQEFYFAGSEQKPSSDLYALAATFHHLIAGSPPPNSNNRLGAVAENRPDPYLPLLGRYPDYDAHLLATVDQCLNLFAKDRLESAAAWRDELDENRRAAARQARAQNDHVIELRIAELVAQNRASLEEVETAPEPVVVEPEVAPKEDPKLEAEREYWAILNEDPSDWDDAEEAIAPAEEAPKPDVTRRKTDFIEPIRAREAAIKAFFEEQANGPTPEPKLPTELDQHIHRVTPSRPVTKARPKSKMRPTSRSRLSLSSLMPWGNR